MGKIIINWIIMGKNGKIDDYLGKNMGKIIINWIIMGNIWKN